MRAYIQNIVWDIPNLIGMSDEDINKIPVRLEVDISEGKDEVDVWLMVEEELFENKINIDKDNEWELTNYDISYLGYGLDVDEWQEVESYRYDRDMFNYMAHKEELIKEAEEKRALLKRL